MTWNYRIIDFGDYLALHEVHYDESGNVKYYTTDPITFVADPSEAATGIIGGLEMALKDAKTRSILTVNDLPGAEQ